MARLFVIGAGMTTFGPQPEVEVHELARRAVWEALGASGLPGFDAPYALGTVALDAGPGFIGQLHDWQGKALRPGMRVRLAIARIKAEKDGTEVVGPKFVPVED